VAGVSVLVLTYNEELNLPGCLASAAWSDDLHVVDSGSTDATVEIARRFGAKVYVHPFENFSAQRNWALRNAAFRRETLKLLGHQADTGLPARWRGTPAERRRWLKHLHLRLPFRGLRKFLYLFLWRGGILDGVPGLVFCVLMAAQEFMLAGELRALKRASAATS